MVEQNITKVRQNGNDFEPALEVSHVIHDCKIRVQYQYSRTLSQREGAGKINPITLMQKRTFKKWS